ncbi:chemotaxis protein CheC [Cuneatibacter sp. NSJ-177]|uniref:chemotaxis protein CheC n=1 Tax=Cuneatibacter sp. NSJ-177 TaxID=2931401 RepID=UPI001FD206CE|nr:chemotaxis protein CheC [Cuneatibacter sp. NSJ-177]MCJ7835929.1 chemotaxis protein CheC [Cuneatibacter sp. NSJ-177]
MDQYSDLNNTAKEILAEIGNIGTGHAITSLSEMIGRRIDMDCPSVHILEYHKVPELLGGVEQVQAGVLLQVTGDISGMFMFLISESFLKIMLQELTGVKIEDVGRLEEMERSAVCEMGNIMCCSYINALAQMMNFKIDVSVPDLCVDMTGALLSVPMIYFANISDELLLIQASYHLGDLSVVNNVLFLPEMESLKRIFEALGESYEG